VKILFGGKSWWQEEQDLFTNQKTKTNVRRRLKVSREKIRRLFIYPPFALWAKGFSPMLFGLFLFFASGANSISRG